MINELDLLWLPIFLVLRIYFLYSTKFSRNEGIDICFIVEYVLLDRNFDFVGGYLVVTARYLVVAMVTARFLVVTVRCWWLLVVTAYYCSFPLLVWKDVLITWMFRKKSTAI